jgi:aspartate kinase
MFVAQGFNPVEEVFWTGEVWPMPDVVIKLGGSVLVDLPSYSTCAHRLRARLDREPGTRLVVVVSARYGETDELLALARSLAADPDPGALDLLWSTGEIKSAATLALCLQSIGVRAIALDVHQAGLRRTTSLVVDPAPLRQALANHAVVVVPGFLAEGDDGAVVSLGRGGSDLSAVAIAAALGASRCELVKDVPGYFTADPNACTAAEHLPLVDYARALQMARDGCDLVQVEAIDSARRAGLTLVIRGGDDSRHTLVSN